MTQRRVPAVQDVQRTVDISANLLPLAMATGCCENTVGGNLDEPLAMDAGGFDAIIYVGVFSFVEEFDTCFDEMVHVSPFPLFSWSELVGGILPWRQDGCRPIVDREHVGGASWWVRRSRAALSQHTQS